MGFVQEYDGRRRGSSIRRAMRFHVGAAAAFFAGNDSEFGAGVVGELRQVWDCADRVTAAVDGDDQDAQLAADSSGARDHVIRSRSVSSVLIPELLARLGGGQEIGVGGAALV